MTSPLSISFSDTGEIINGQIYSGESPLAQAGWGGDIDWNISSIQVQFNSSIFEVNVVENDGTRRRFTAFGSFQFSNGALINAVVLNGYDLYSGLGGDTEGYSYNFGASGKQLNVESLNAIIESLGNLEESQFETSEFNSFEPSPNDIASFYADPIRNTQLLATSDWSQKLFEIHIFANEASQHLPTPSQILGANFDPVTGINTINLDAAGGSANGTNGITDRFNLSTSGTASPARISSFNTTEDFIIAPRDALNNLGSTSLKVIRQVVSPEGPLSKAESKAFKKESKALQKDLKNLVKGKNIDPFAYNQLTGELFFDANGKKKGFGDGGGLLAILEGSPDFSSNNLQIL